MTNKLIETLELEAKRAEEKAKRIRLAIDALQSVSTPELKPITSGADVNYAFGVREKRLAALEKARAARWDNNKYAGRKEKLDKALRQIFVDSAHFTVNQTLQILTRQGITQKAYRDRRSFSNCVYHSLRELAKEGMVRAVRPEGVKEIIWETVQPSLPMVALPTNNETHEVPEL